MTPSELAAIELEKSLVAAGVIVSRDDSVVQLPQLKLHVTASVIQVKQFDPNDWMLAVVFEVASPADEWPGPAVTQVGTAESARAAARHAAEQWCDGVLCVIYSLFGAKGRRLGVEYSDHARMSPGARGGPDIYRIHHGPLQMMVWGDGQQPRVPKYGAMFNALLPALLAVELDHGLHWFECYVARGFEGEIDATVRCNNEQWDLGETALCGYASSWPHIGPRRWSQRQFILFQPVVRKRGGAAPARRARRPSPTRGAAPTKTARPRPGGTTGRRRRPR